MMDKVSESSDTSEGAHIEKTKEKSHFLKMEIYIKKNKWLDP